ncbi:hypothetical protein [Acinetobacter baumannii]|uniref:hypothetical protein n=1 Tax=Acinetobacter baumannii TaxID=470 RepID=UPI0002AEBD78|nr:hypothetical protein [Acinetobacter baumannii]ELW87833.1 hypothetical protein ACINAA014_2533 [Acinetobacter baumannii AA-014]
MTDLNKEREAFLNTFQYYKGRRDIIFSHEHELFMTRSNNPSEVAQKEISNMNSRWDAWLRCAKHRDAELEKAKAQAVPEGYVLLPRVPTEKMLQAYERYSVAPMSTLSKTGYKAMVEAAGDQNENS